MDERHFTAAPSFADKLRALDWKKIAIILVALALVAVLVIVLINVIFGSSKNDPIKYKEKYANAKEIDYIKMTSEAFNGVDGGNMAKILKVLAKSEDFKDLIEEMEEGFKEDYEDNVDEYGKNFKITYKNDKEMEEKLDRDELKRYKAQIKTVGENILDLVDEFKDMDKDEQKEAAEDIGITYNDLKEMLKYLEAFGRELKSATVDDGYELEVIETITGKELDEPEEDEIDMTVLKVNGKWICLDLISLSFLSTLY